MVVSGKNSARGSKAQSASLDAQPTPSDLAISASSQVTGLCHNSHSTKKKVKRSSDKAIASATRARQLSRVCQEKIIRHPTDNHRMGNTGMRIRKTNEKKDAGTPGT